MPFDQVPELSLPQVTEQVLQGIEKKYDLIVTNFANGDVIGHTSNNDAKDPMRRSLWMHGWGRLWMQPLQPIM